MSLRDQFTEQLKVSMKAGDANLFARGAGPRVPGRLHRERQWNSACVTSPDAWLWR